MKDYVNKIGLWHSIVHDKEIETSGQIFEKDMELRKYRNELNDLKSQISIYNEDVRIFLFISISYHETWNILFIISNKKTKQCDLKQKELKDCKLELSEFMNEVKKLRNEIMCKDQQIYSLKEKLHEQTLEVIDYFFISRFFFDQFTWFILFYFFLRL